MTPEHARETALATIDQSADRLIEVSRKMQAEVELAFDEYKAQGWLCDVMDEAGLEVTHGLGTLQTAFRGTGGQKQAGPSIAFLCEYDGLPVYGQSCGHNVAAAASLGAGLGFASVVDALGGRCIIMGTPGEEGGGGKHILCSEGWFDDLDAMMLIYPGMDNIAHSRAVGATRVEISYHGKAAHAAARPELGINALDALLLALNGVSALRQQLPSDVRVHYIITKGGTLPQVIPDHVTAVLTLRANDPATVRAVKPRIDACLEGAARMTGARLDRQWSPSVGQPLLSNAAMAGRFDGALRGLGRETRGRDELSGAWSGDTNAVSWKVPTIQPQIAMTGRDVPPHSHEFHAASVGPAAEACILDAAKAMALTAIDLVTDPTLMPAVRAEFEAARG
ncbi:MAG: amidohydrolase [Marinibacterium profundimaris]